MVIISNWLERGGKVKKYLTIMELEEQTNIPGTTIRRYIQKFPDFFVAMGGNRGKRYDEMAIKVLARIKNLFDNGYETDGVDSIIRNEFPIVVDSDKDEKDKENNKLNLATAEDIAEIKEALKEQQQFNKVLLEKLDHQEKYIKESIEKRDQILMESLRNMQEGKQKELAATTEETPKKSWWNRFFSK